MSEPFPVGFRELLAEVVRRAPRVRGSRDDQPRARRRRAGITGLFAGHRAYSLGDDLRLLDWNVYARSGELFVKMLEEEDRRTVTLFLDVSPSMRAGDRFVGAQRLAAVLGSLALAQLDAIHLANGLERPRTLEGSAARQTLLEWLEEQKPESTHSPERGLATLERDSSGRVCWISDFAEPESYRVPLALLRRRGRPCVGWLPALPIDRAVPEKGWLRLLDPETGRTEKVQIDGRLAAAMEEELALLSRHQDAVFRDAGFPLIRFAIPEREAWDPAAWLEVAWTSSL